MRLYALRELLQMADQLRNLYPKDPLPYPEEQLPRSFLTKARNSQSTTRKMKLVLNWNGRDRRRRTGV
jgi:hypothetical protein